MKDFFIISISILVIGCAGGVDLFQADAGQVSEGNNFSFRDTVVKVNRDFKFLHIEEKHKIPGSEIDTAMVDVYQVSNHYLFLGVDRYNKVSKAAMITLISLSNHQIQWNHRVDLFKGVKAIQKGKEKIAGKEYWSLTYKSFALSEKVYFTLEDEGYRVNNFGCWLVKSYWKVLGHDAGVVLMITYLEGLNNCYGLDNGGPDLGPYWEKAIAEFSERVCENVKITHP